MRARGWLAFLLPLAIACRKEAQPAPAPDAATNGYTALVSELRVAGMSTDPGCESPPVAEFVEPSREPLARLAAGPDGPLVSAARWRALDRASASGTIRLSAAQRALFFFSLLDGEVKNGGFHQFFSNSSGDCAREALAAVRELDLNDVLAIYQRALAVFPDAPARDRAGRNEQMKRIPNEFSAWRAHDTAYYALTGVDAASARYVRAHLAEIDAPRR